MSLQETRQIFDLLVKINDILDGITVKTTTLEQKTPQIREQLSSFRELERVALRYLIIARRVGLGEDFNRATQIISQMIVMVRMLQMSVNMLMMGTPIGLLMGAASITLTMFAASDFAMSAGE